MTISKSRTHEGEKSFVLERISGGGQTEAKIRASISAGDTSGQPSDGCCAGEKGGRGEAGQW